VLTTTFGGAWLATRGGKKAEAKPVAGQSVRQVKDSIPLNAGSIEEEAFIKQFIAEAEKDDAKH